MVFKKGDLNYSKICGGSFKGKKHKEESKNKIREANKGKKCSETTKRKISKSMIGDKNHFYGKHHTKETKNKINGNKERAKKISLSKLGDKNPMKNPEVVKKSMLNRNYKKIGEKISKSKKGKPNNSPTKFKKGYKMPKEWIEKRRSYDGKNNPMWNGGSSFEPYDQNWTPKFRRAIRKRDNQICMLCGIHREKLNRALSVHHINYYKLMSLPQNCVSLCNKCHVKTQSKRTHWTKFFQSLLNEKYGYLYENGNIVLSLEGVRK